MCVDMIMSITFCSFNLCGDSIATDGHAKVDQMVVYVCLLHLVLVGTGRIIAVGSSRAFCAGAGAQVVVNLFQVCIYTYISRTAALHLRTPQSSHDRNPSQWRRGCEGRCPCRVWRGRCSISMLRIRRRLDRPLLAGRSCRCWHHSQLSVGLCEENFLSLSFTFLLRKTNWRELKWTSTVSPPRWSHRSQSAQRCKIPCKMFCRHRDSWSSF